MSAPRFTVIVACYQTEPYLVKALDSIKRQSFGDFEAICYVEESADDSLAVCRNFVAGDPRFKVATGPKSGAVATTRNYGIDHAAGEYLVVLDGDDWLAPDMLEKLDSKLRRTGGVDVLSFAAVTTESEDATLENSPRLTNFRAADAEDVFPGLEALRRAGRSGGEFRSYTWLSAYRVGFLREHRLYQSDGLMMEDFEHTPRVWFRAARMAYIDEVFYVYRRRAGSLTTQSSPRLVSDLAHQVVSLLEFAAHEDVPGDIMKLWGNQWLMVFYWFMFHPVSSRKVPDEERRKALRIVFANGGKERLKRIAARASLPRRVALPLLSLAAAGWQFPAKFYFRKLYYPLAERRR